MAGIIIFFIAFQILFGIVSGGVAPRLMYAFTVSKGFWNFWMNYCLSYQVSYDQIHSTEKYIPEVNDTLERLLALALEGNIDVGLSLDEWRNNTPNLRIRTDSFYILGGNRTLNFRLTQGTLDSTAYALSPTVFILGEKVYRKKMAEREAEKLKKKRDIF